MGDYATTKPKSYLLDKMLCFGYSENNRKRSK